MMAKTRMVLNGTMQKIKDAFQALEEITQMFETLAFRVSLRGFALYGLVKFLAIHR
jgi:hypothetical protein